MKIFIASALLAGLLSGIFFLVVFGASLGFVFMFLPTLPLFCMGLSRRAQTLPIAVTTSTVFVTLTGGVASGLLFLVFLGIPAWYISRNSLRHIPATGDEPPLWYPVGNIMTALAIYASSLIAVITWYYADLPGGLPQMLSQNIHDAFSDLQGEYGDIIDEMAGGWSFLMFPITIWLWGILLYGHAWLANRGLMTQAQQIRDNFSISVFIIPGWMLHLLAICALATLIGSPSMSFLGKSTLLSLMLPYFFLGCALMHRYTKKWPQSSINGRFLLFFIYFLVFTQLWPVLILAAIGLTHQIKYLSQGSHWFKH